MIFLRSASSITLNYLNVHFFLNIYIVNILKLFIKIRSLYINHSYKRHSFIPDSTAFLLTFFHSAILGIQYSTGLRSSHFPRNRYSPIPALVPQFNGLYNITYCGGTEFEWALKWCGTIKSFSSFVLWSSVTRTVSSLICRSLLWYKLVTVPWITAKEMNFI